MNLFKPLFCHHCGASLNNHMDATVCPQCNKDLSQPAESGAAPAGGAPQPESTPPNMAILRRYQDAYLTARAITVFGTTVKTLAIVLGGFATLIGLGALSQSGTMGFIAIGSGITFAISVHVLGILVSAQGQILQAALDTAVNTSPILTQEEMRQIMSLP
jgi:hypothetical protein